MGFKHCGAEMGYEQIIKGSRILGISHFCLANNCNYSFETSERWSE